MGYEPQEYIKISWFGNAILGMKKNSHFEKGPLRATNI
jgi:hypothetical protein